MLKFSCAKCKKLQNSSNVSTLANYTKPKVFKHNNFK